MSRLLIALERCIELLCEKNNHECSECIHGKGMFPFYVYEQPIRDLERVLYDEDLLDKNYSKHCKELEDKPIELYTQQEVLSRLTFIYRGERFCDGHIEYWIESGGFLRLLERYMEMEGSANELL